MVNGCTECTRLWRDYAEATHDHFRLDNKLQLAGVGHDHEAVQALTPIVTESCQRRIAVREKITAHERECHETA
jgi:hypothetical protein